MTKWRDISTAPRDGTQVLLCGEVKEVCGRNGWQITTGFYHGERPLEGLVPGNYNWVENYDAYYIALIRPTHWMPLPEAPKREEEG